MASRSRFMAPRQSLADVIAEAARVKGNSRDICFARPRDRPMGRFLLAWIVVLAFAASPAIASAAPSVCGDHLGKSMAMAGHGSATSHAGVRPPAAPCDHGVNGCGGSLAGHDHDHPGHAAVAAE